ncbi:hypothetical protein LCGC14_2971930, partial [marine sediment metagenome]
MTTLLETVDPPVTGTKDVTVGVSWFDGKLYRAGADGLPGRVPLARPWTIRPPLDGRPQRNPIIMVHGYRYDPRAANRDNPHRSTFPTWRGQLLEGRETVGFGWYSVPKGIGGVLRAWWHGRYNTYR